jgi:hypothetical protein
MDPDVQTFAQVSVILVFLVGSLTTIAVLATRAIKRSTNLTLRSTQLSDQRLDQLQQSIDAIAVEVERIAEAQRFSAKLLAERGEAVTPQR